MHRLFFSILLALSLAMPCAANSASAAPPAPTSTEVEPHASPAAVPAAYAPVLDSMHELLAHGLRGRELRDGEAGVAERWAGQESAEALASVGWALRDLNGDDRPELLLAAVEKNGDGRHLGHQLYAVYTIRGGHAELVLEGMARSAFALTDGGLLMHHGSASATTGIFGACALSPDGSKLVWRDYWFTMEKGADREIGFYWNDSGRLDSAVSHERSEAEFREAVQSLLALRREAEFTPFSGWLRTAPALRLEWADDVSPDELKSALRIVASSDLPQTQIAIHADRTVTDFKVLKLEFLNVDANDRIHFQCTELVGLDLLEPGRPLILALSIPGTIPHYGISYVDELGVGVRFAVTQSGQDGSLQLMPF